MAKEVKRCVRCLIWSFSARQSHYVELEWTAAISTGLEIIPCVTDSCPLPAVLKNRQWVTWEGEATCRTLADHFTGGSSRFQPSTQTAAPRSPEVEPYDPGQKLDMSALNAAKLRPSGLLWVALALGLTIIVAALVLVGIGYWSR